MDEIDEAAQKNINAVKVLVVGVGGLGSSVLLNLASIGVEHFGLADFDEVSLSNLNRQYIHNQKGLGQKKVVSAKAWLQDYNSKIKVKCFDEKLTCDNSDEILAGFDIIVDCLDNWEGKFLLSVACEKLSKPLVHGGVEGYRGQVMTILPNSKKLTEIFDGQNPQAEVFRGIIAPIVSIIGAIQANEVLNLVLGKEVLSNKILMYDVETNESRRIDL